MYLPAHDSNMVFSLVKHVAMATPSSLSSETDTAGGKSTYLYEGCVCVGVGGGGVGMCEYVCGVGGGGVISSMERSENTFTYFVARLFTLEQLNISLSTEGVLRALKWACSHTFPSA